MLLSPSRVLGMSTGVRFASLAVLLLVAAGCKQQTSASAPLGKPPSEAALGRVTLTPEAEVRLGIAPGLTPLVLSHQPPRRLLRGEVIAPPGRSAWILAPHAGVVLPPPGMSLPAAGAHVQAGQVVALLAASLAPTERAQLSIVQVDADAQVERARVQDEASELALARAERLLAEDAASIRSVEEAKAQRQLARTALQAALVQRDALGRTNRTGPAPGPQRGTALGQTSLASPFAGVVRELRVAAAQQVLPGTPVLEVIAEGPTWVRVAIPAGELATLAAAAPTLIAALGAADSLTSVVAEPAQDAPQTAQPTLGTVDRYFALPKSAHFVLGQRVAAWIPLRGDSPVPAVPASALLHDPSGGSWVYEQAAAQVFVRRRVEVARIEDGVAVLSPTSLQSDGLRVGSLIVTSGSMELYGAEFASGK